MTLQNCYIGLDITGSATAEVDAHVERADVFAVRNKATCSVRLVGQRLHRPQAEGDLCRNLEVEDALQGVKAVSGTTSIHGLTAASNKIALGASAGATLEAHDVTVSASGLAVDASDATALSVDVLDVSTTTTLLQGRSVAGLAQQRDCVHQRRQHGHEGHRFALQRHLPSVLDQPRLGQRHRARVWIKTTGFTDVVLSATNVTRPVLEATDQASSKPTR